MIAPSPLCTLPLRLQPLQRTPCPPGAVADDDDDDDDEDYDDDDELSLIVAALRRHFLSIIAHSRTVGAKCAFRMQNCRVASYQKSYADKIT